MTRHALLVIVLLFASAATKAGAQTTHTVSVQGTSFSPSTLEIKPGDIVRWVNDNSGFHNINGSAASYPTNPVGFIDSEQTRLNFEYEFTFTELGTYGYHCDEHGTPTSGMKGVITVANPTAVEESDRGWFSVGEPHPNPFSGSTSVEVRVETAQNVRAAVYDAAGREVALIFDGLIAADSPKVLTWTPADLASGLYAIRLQGESFVAVRTGIRLR